MYDTTLNNPADIPLDEVLADIRRGQWTDKENKA
jgi:hypothetical protein